MADEVNNLTEASFELGPAERLRERILGTRGRLAIIAGAFVIWIMDVVFSRFLIIRGTISGVDADHARLVENIGTAIFVVTIIVLIIAVVRGSREAMFRIIAVYLTFSVIQVIFSVITMVSSVTARKGFGLGSLWDVAAMYVFTFVYVYLDVVTPKGAFIWPAREGETPPTPNIADYIFISLNVNSTYGPTSEVVMSRPTKLIMGLQVLLSILMLTVLIARAVSATS